MLEFLMENKELWLAFYLSLVGVASVIVRLIPVLPSNHKLLPFLKLLAKFVALNKSVSDTERVKVDAEALKRLDKDK